MTKRFRFSTALLTTLAIVACETPTEAPADIEAPVFSLQDVGTPSLIADAGGDAGEFMAAVNAELAAQGLGMAISHAEWIDGVGDTDALKTVFANDRTKLLGTQWVAGDARRGATSNDLTQGSFPFFQFADGVATEPIIDATFDTWNAVTCSNLTVNKVGLAPGVFPSAVLSLPGFVNDPFAADVSTVGWLPGFLFDAVLGPGASASVLGVTFTFIFIDADGNPSDIDGDGRTDTAIKEVWYNDEFTWTDTGAGGIDIESVALHENGHALEAGHFGKLTAHFKKGGVRIQASPRAVMNASYIGPVRSPLGTDKATMCGNYGNWGN